MLWVVIEDACEHVFVPIQFIVTVIHTTWRSENVRAALQTFNLTYLRSRTSDAVLSLGVGMTDHECRECISVYADSKADTAIRPSFMDRRRTKTGSRLHCGVEVEAHEAYPK